MRKKNIVVIGEVLVEIMADQVGQGFLQPLALQGPFPSGAPAIFIAQAAALGQGCAILSAVGDDDFGTVCTNRLSQLGVDIAGISIDNDRPTGTAFVRYRPSGARDFIFNIKHSACGHFRLDEQSHTILEHADHLHIMGSSLSSEAFFHMNLEAARVIKSRGGTISFDPNLRKELLDQAQFLEAMQEMLALTDLYLPSGEELSLFTQEKDDKAAIAELLESGIQAIVHKCGAEGANYYDAKRHVFAPAFAAQEIDPTGAGDCFGGAFVALWLEGAAPEEALAFACAAGAQAVSIRGPMEGVSDRTVLTHIIETGKVETKKGGD